MTNSEFLERIAEILNTEVSDVQMTSKLGDFPHFDSVAVLSIIVLMDELGQTVSGAAVRGCPSVADLWALAKQ